MCHRGFKRNDLKSWTASEILNKRNMVDFVVSTVATVSHVLPCARKYRQAPNKSRTLVINKIVIHSDVVGASPVGASPTTSSLST